MCVFESEREENEGGRWVCVETKGEVNIRRNLFAGEWTVLRIEYRAHIHTHILSRDCKMCNNRHGESSDTYHTQKRRWSFSLSSRQQKSVSKYNIRGISFQVKLSRWDLIKAKEKRTMVDQKLFNFRHTFATIQTVLGCSCRHH